MKFLATEAHDRNLSIGLKNAGSIVDDVVDLVEWSVQEQCIQFGGCKEYQCFIKADNPIFSMLNIQKVMITIAKLPHLSSIRYALM